MIGILLIAAEIGAQDVVQTLARRCSAARSYSLEDLNDCPCRSDVVVQRVVLVVEKVNVNAVVITRRADWRYGLQSFGSLTPGATCHAAAVIDQEDGIE